MPSADAILSWATAAANDWRWLAIVWHIAAALLIALAGGVRLSQRHAGVLLVLPVISVAVVAWLSGNPFNGLTFSLLSAALGAVAMRLSKRPATYQSARWLVPGAALVAFGLAYPHFLRPDTWMEYVYASPFGVLPCPTLSTVVGMTLVFGGLQSAAWIVPLVASGLLFGLIGIFTLGVGLDIGLLAGSILLGGMLVAIRFVRHGTAEFQPLKHAAGAQR